MLRIFERGGRGKIIKISRFSVPVCKKGGRPNLQTEQTWLPGCPEKNNGRSRRQDSLTSSAPCDAVAPTLPFYLRLRPLCSSAFVSSAAQIGTVRESLR